MSTTKHQRNGASLTELVVAATLMVSTMAVVAPLTVRTGRMWQDSRHHLLVMDELSNELERLSSLTPQQLQVAIADLAPPEHLKATLTSATLTAATIHDTDGTRLRLSMNWDRPGNPPPVSLVGWLDSMPSSSPQSQSDLDASEETR